MRNLFYIEEAPSGLRAKVGDSLKPSVEIVFDSLVILEDSDYVLFYHFNSDVCGGAKLDRFNKIDKEVLSLLPRDSFYCLSELAYHYRKCGRCLRQEKVRKRNARSIKRRNKKNETESK